MKTNSIWVILLLLAGALSAGITFELTFGDSVYSEFGSALKVTPDGGYIIAGSKAHHITYYDDHAFLLKVDQWGQPEWEKKMGPAHSAADVVPLEDAGYLLLANRRGGGVFAVRVDAQGDTVWSNTMHTSNHPYYATHLEKSGNSFIFAAPEMWLTGALKKPAQDSTHLVIVKFDAAGVKSWERVFVFKSGLGSCTIVAAQDGDFFVAGSIPYSGDTEPAKIFLMKLNSAGEQVWLKYFDENIFWWGSQLVLKNDELIFAGTLESGGERILLMKTDANGELLWRHEYGDENYPMSAWSLVATADGFILGGNPHLIKVDESGQILWQRNYAALLETRCLIQTPDLGLALGGLNHSEEFVGYFDHNLVVIKTDPQGNSTKIGQTTQPAENFELFQNYPNPFNASTVISYDLPEATGVTLQIFNANGQQVETLVNSIQNAGRHQTVWNAGRHSSGVYFFKISAGDFFSMRKCVLVR
jgi:outer membrane protein assembly factor BamB